MKKSLKTLIIALCIIPLSLLVFQFTRYEKADKIAKNTTALYFANKESKYNNSYDVKFNSFGEVYSTKTITSKGYKVVLCGSIKSPYTRKYSFKSTVIVPFFAKSKVIKAKCFR